MANKLLVLFAVALTAVSAYWGPDLPPGPYCGSNNMCCRNRQDGCSHRILDSLCYCDEFCNRTEVMMENNDDCCPDYVPVCLGYTEPPEDITSAVCKHNGKKYLPGETRMEDCNTCVCTFDKATKVERWDCERDLCIISDEVLYGVRQSANWRPFNYTKFSGKKLKNGIVYLLGTNELSPMTRRMGSITYDKEIDYPTHFDARQKWPGFISEVRDQGWCGSDWAISSATVASDRFAIQSNGAERVILSPQMLISCNERYQKACDGGNIDVAWNFVSNIGLVDEDCFPYKGKKTKCPFRKRDSLINDGCRPIGQNRTSRYRVGPAGRLKKEHDIVYDIMESGPVQAIMTVYQDFFHYRDGVYRHTRHGDQRYKGLHSVRIVGWGEERGEKYWVVANSWGEDWGERGYFRIARGSNESGIESFILTVLSEVTAYQRK